MIYDQRLGKVVAAATLMVTATAISGCTSGASDSGPVTLQVWDGFAGTEHAALVKVLDKYWAPSHPNIKLQLSGDKTADAMTTAITGSHSPDVIIAPGSENPTAWWRSGAIMDLTPLVKQIGPQLNKEVVPAALAWGRQGGTTFALPFVDYNWGIFYNKTMFKAAGLDPKKPPSTTTELATDAKKLTKIDSKGNLVQLGWQPVIDNSTAIALSMAFGARFIDAAGRPTLNTPAVNAALTWDTNLAKTVGLAKEEKFISGYTTGETPFQLGKVAIYIDGSWQASMLKDSKIDWGYAAIPAVDPKFSDSSPLGTNPIVIPKAAGSHAKQAEQFVRFLTLNPQVSGQFASAIANLPQVKSQLGTFSTNPAEIFFAKLSNSSNARAWAPVPYSQVYSDQITKAVGEIYTNGANIASTLATTQNVVSEQAKNYR